MTVRDRARFRADRRSRQLLRALGEELRTARLAAGLSQRAVGRAIGVSGAQVGRLERAVLPSASLHLFSLSFAAVGMRLTAKAFPEGPPVRDAGQLRLLARLKSQLGPPLRLRTEVPIGIEGDLRAWDGEIFTADETCKVEAETHLHDVQATDRRIGLKMADGRADRAILLVADTRHNRDVLRETGHLLIERYPLGTRAVPHSLRRGALPDGCGIVIL